MAAHVLFVAVHALGGAVAGEAQRLLASAASAVRDAARASGERMAAARLLAALAGSGSEALLQRILPRLLDAAAAVR